MILPLFFCTAILLCGNNITDQQESTASDHRVGMFDQDGKLNPSFAKRKVDVQKLPKKLNDGESTPSLFDEDEEYEIVGHHKGTNKSYFQVEPRYPYNPEILVFSIVHRQNILYGMTLTYARRSRAMYLSDCILFTNFDSVIHEINLLLENTYLYQFQITTGNECSRCITEGDMVIHDLSQNESIKISELIHANPSRFFTEDLP